MATTAIGATAATTDTTSAGRARMADNMDMFLTLLTAQMKNQDPTSPMDSNQFMAQLVQMTGVEQQLAGNELLKKLVANTGTSLASVADLIGKEVRADSAETRLANGQAKWGYTLGADAKDVMIEVLDGRGAPVRILSASDADRTAGEHSFVWDGKDATGVKQPDGAYTLRITATDATRATVTSKIFVQGLVTAVEQAPDGKGVLTVNGGKVTIDKVTSVALPAAAVTAATNANNTPAGQTTPAAA